MSSVGADLLPTVDEFEFRQVRGIATRVNLATGEVLFRTGDVADSMFCVESGRVELAFDDGRPPRHAGPLACFGELSLISDRGERTTSARATEPTVLWEVDRDTFQELVRSEASFLLRMLVESCTYLLDAERHLSAQLKRKSEELEVALDQLSRTREELDSQHLSERVDKVTSLYTGAVLRDQGPSLVRRSGRGAIVVIDALDLEELRATYGARVADRVLRLAADTVRASCAKRDLPCRVGEASFAVLLVDVDAAAARACAEILVERLGALRLPLVDGMVEPAFAVAVGALGPDEAVDAALERILDRVPALPGELVQA